MNTENMPQWKRIALIVGFIIVSAFLAFLLYYIFAPRKAPPIVSQTTPPIGPDEKLPTPGEREIPPSRPPITSGDKIFPPPIGAEIGLPETVEEAAGGPVQITEIFSDRAKETIQIAQDGRGLVAYSMFDGKFYELQPDGSKTTLGDQTFFGVDRFSFSPKNDKVFIEFYDESNIMYDFANKKQVTFPKHWDQLQAAPSGQEVGFKSLGEDPENRWLAIANADGTNARALEPLGKSGAFFEVNWSPSDQIVGTFREGIDGERQKIFFIGKNGENFKNMIVEGRGFESTWSTNGDKLLYSVHSPRTDFKPELWIVNAIGDDIGNDRQRLSLNTWSEKCSFADNDSVYCAVPIEMVAGAGLYPQVSKTVTDDIYRIDLQTGVKTKLASMPEPHTVASLAVSDDESLLYFVDEQSGKTFKINLR